jgi:hypothetical protein
MTKIGWVLYLFLLIPGVAVSLFAQGVPPVDSRIPMGLLLSIFLLPVTLQSHGTRYGLTVSSWRPGRSEELLNVVEGVFDRAQVAKPVVLEVHSGYFGLPWIGKVSTQ